MRLIRCCTKRGPMISIHILICIIIGMILSLFYKGLFSLRRNSGTVSNLKPMIEFPSIKPHSCVKSSILHGVTATICVKPDDMFISLSVLMGGAWEPEIVTNMLRALSLYHDAALVDVGCNIGMYTIMAAGMGRRVVAVDAVAENLAYVHASLTKDGRNDLVTLLHNSVSNNENLTLYPILHEIESQNPGATKQVSANKLIYSNMMASGPPTHSILLPTLFSNTPSSTIILKMDIEGWECRALLAHGVFNTGKFIPYIFMEWEHLIKNVQFLYKNSDNCDRIQTLLGHLTSNGYKAWHPVTLEALDNATLHSTIKDVLWVHKTAQPLSPQT